MRWVLFLAALLLPTGAVTQPALPDSYALVPGSFEAGRQPDGNSVLVEAPEGVIVVDTGRHAAHQQAILARVAELERPIAAIVNTHWHLDHTGGNAELLEVFPHAPVIASRAIEGALTGFLAESRRGAEAYIASGQADAATIAEIEGDFAAIDAPEALRPTEPVTASGAREIAERPIEVNLAPHAATEGDVWLFDPAAETVIAGDLVVAFAPFMDTACIEGWLAALEAIAAKDFRLLIPGHGAPMTRGDFDRWHGAFRNLVACADGTADASACIAGWRYDAAPFLGDIAPDRVTALIGHYMQSRLRAVPVERNRYCAHGG